MYNAIAYELEKQASRPSQPMNHTEMIRVYGQASRQKAALIRRLGTIVINAAHTMKVKSHPQPKVAPQA